VTRGRNLSEERRLHSTALRRALYILDVLDGADDDDTALVG